MGNTVKLIIEVRLNLEQYFTFGLTLRNNRPSISSQITNSDIFWFLCQFNYT